MALKYCHIEVGGNGSGNGDSRKLKNLNKKSASLRVQQFTFIAADHHDSLLKRYGFVLFLTSVKRTHLRRGRGISYCRNFDERHDSLFIHDARHARSTARHSLEKKVNGRSSIALRRMRCDWAAVKN